MTILIAEDDHGTARLIERNLRRADVTNTVLRFADGQEILDFLFRRGEGKGREDNTPYVLLLDIQMPEVDGIEVLRRIKEDAALRKMPVIMLTTTDDPRTIQKCYDLGCSGYIAKPVQYDKFIGVITKMGQFLKEVQLPLLLI